MVVTASRDCSLLIVLNFDHVIMPVVDFDTTSERLLEQHGLASVPGGRHTGLGTGNRIVPLHLDYIELMGIVDPDEATAGFLGRGLTDRLTRQEGVAALCLLR